MKAQFDYKEMEPVIRRFWNYAEYLASGWTVENGITKTDVIRGIGLTLRYVSFDPEEYWREFMGLMNEYGDKYVRPESDGEMESSYDD